MAKEYIHFCIKFKANGSNSPEESKPWDEWDMMGCVHESVLTLDNDKYLEPYKASLINWYPAWGNEGWTIMNYALFQEITAEKLQEMLNFDLDQMAMKDNYEDGYPPEVVVEETDRVK